MFIAECPSIPGSVSQGKTEQEAEKNIQETIDRQSKSVWMYDLKKGCL